MILLDLFTAVYGLCIPDSEQTHWNRFSNGRRISISVERSYSKGLKICVSILYEEFFFLVRFKIEFINFVPKERKIAGKREGTVI